MRNTLAPAMEAANARSRIAVIQSRFYDQHDWMATLFWVSGGQRPPEILG
jgi:hypothetical protein